MREIVIIALCIVAVQSAARRERPDFDCDWHCRGRGYSRICSTEGKTFDNECYLKCKWNYKECDGPCPCRRELPPAPVPAPAPGPPATPAPRIIYVERPAPPPQYVYIDPPSYNKCGCKRDWDPVCSIDNETYDNKCEAECEGKRVWYDSACF